MSVTPIPVMHEQLGAEKTRTKRTTTAMIDGISLEMAEQIVTSTEIEERVRVNSPGFDLKPGTIERLTGVKTRRMAQPGETSSDYAVRAANSVLEQTGTLPSEIDLLIFASSCQDLTEPATVHIVQDQIGTRANAFDVKNACNSFIEAIHIAEGLIAAGMVRKALICTGETPTVAIRWKVPNDEVWRRGFAGYTVGDGGAAMVLSPAKDGRGIWYRHFDVQSEHWRVMTLPGGGTMFPHDIDKCYYDSDGNSLREIFEAFSPQVMVDSLVESGTEMSDFDFVAIHQVSAQTLEGMIAASGLPQERFVNSVSRFGNISSISLPLQLSEAIDAGTIGEGSDVLLVGLGAGISMGVMMLTL